MSHYASIGGFRYTPYSTSHGDRRGHLEIRWLLVRLYLRPWSVLVIRLSAEMKATSQWTPETITSLCTTIVVQKRLSMCSQCAANFVCAASIINSHNVTNNVLGHHAAFQAASTRLDFTPSRQWRPRDCSKFRDISLWSHLSQRSC